MFKGRIMFKMSHFLWAYLVINFHIVAVTTQNFSVNFYSDGSYDVMVQGRFWLGGAPKFFRVNGKTYTTADGSLKMVKSTVSNGQDFIGQWQSHSILYTAGPSQIETSVIQYTPDPSIFTYNNPPLPFYLFKQKYVNGANNTRQSDTDSLISGFPGFNVHGARYNSLGFLSFGGGQGGSTGLSTGEWGEYTFKIQDGINGGPLALFDTAKTANTLIISPASEFMSSQIWVQKTGSASNVYWGTMGGVDMVPAMFESTYIVFCGNQGINKAFVSWGEILRTMYGRTDQFRKSDFTINYLGYWTDNGGYYYGGRPEPGKNMEDTLVDVVNDIRTRGVPIRYIQYDDWWFVKDTEGGIIDWEAASNIFPNGVRVLYNKTNLPVLGYSKFWSSRTVYAKQNGGSYNFIIDGTKSLPTEERFWTDLLQTGRQWGLIGFEHDYLSTQMGSIGALNTDLFLGRQWLKQMGNAVAKNGLTVQYCMTLPKEMLQSLEISVVTQARASHDYHPGQDNWKIGVSSLFQWALGLAPFKDNFWTSEVEPGYKNNATEPYSALNSVVATLSTGPVGVSDMVGTMNKSLVMRSANADGLILKPSRPATAIDNRIRRMAWWDFEGPDGEVWSTYSDFGGENKYGIVLAAGLNGTYNMTPCMAGYQGFPYSMVFPAANPTKIQPLTDPQPLSISGCTLENFCLYYVSPVLNINGKQVLIQGELDKWVPMSPQRVTDISVGDDIVINLTGAANETVDFWFNVDGKSTPLTCTLGSGGLATLSFTQGTCRGE